MATKIFLQRYQIVLPHWHPWLINVNIKFTEIYKLLIPLYYLLNILVIILLSDYVVIMKLLPYYKNITEL